MDDQLLECFPRKNEVIRKGLWSKGERNILCVGINPNTANELKLDSTTANVEKIAQLNGYDGWFLVNLYPVRSSSVSSLDKEPVRELMWENLRFIANLMSANQFGFDKIWVAWGNDIESGDHTYLLECAYYLSRILSRFDMGYVCIGVNKYTKHPTHPSPQAIAGKYRGDYSKTVFQPFDMEDYAKMIKNRIKVEPDIAIDGIEFK